MTCARYLSHRELRNKKERKKSEGGSRLIARKKKGIAETLGVEGRVCFGPLHIQAFRFLAVDVVRDDVSSLDLFLPLAFLLP